MCQVPGKTEKGKGGGSLGLGGVPEEQLPAWEVWVMLEASKSRGTEVLKEWATSVLRHPSQQNCRKPVVGDLGRKGSCRNKVRGSSSHLVDSDSFLFLE